jgi:hypothetical protein
MPEITFTGNCLFCRSSNTQFLQDEHHKTDQHGSRVGILKCLDCNMASFWYAKVKEKFSIQDNKIILTSRPVINIKPCWDGPITSWLYGHIEESSIRTGRPIQTYYTNMVIEDSKITERYLELTTDKEKIIISSKSVDNQ